MACQLCKLKSIPGSSDFEGPANKSITLVTKDVTGTVMIEEVTYGGVLLVPRGQAVSQLTFDIAPGAEDLEMVCVFTDNRNGAGQLREDAPPDSQFLIDLSIDEPFKAFTIVGKSS